MKKLAAMYLSFLLSLSLVACGGPSSEIKPPDSVIPAETTSADKTEVENTDAPVVTTAPLFTDASIPETVILDEAGIKITAKSLEADELFGAELKLLIENNSDKNLTIQARNTSVNGYMVMPVMSEDVVAGKKANGSLTIMSSSLEKCGISTIADIEFSLTIFTTEDWESYLDTDIITLKTTAADSYEYTFDDSGDVVYEKDGIKIVVRGLIDDSILGPGISVYMENNSDAGIIIQTRDVSINGFMVDPVFSSQIAAGKHAVETITFMSDELEENEITEIETVELSFYLFNPEDWSSAQDTDTVTINFK